MLLLPEARRNPERVSRSLPAGHAGRLQRAVRGSASAVHDTHRDVAAGFGKAPRLLRTGWFQEVIAGAKLEYPQYLLDDPDADIRATVDEPG